MLLHPGFDPVAISIGPVSVRWYGLMYLFGFAALWFLGRLRIRDEWRGMSENDLDDLLFYAVCAVIIGGRLGFCIFYQPSWYLSHPIDIFKLWHGGMSAHGGIAGAIAAAWIFSLTHGKKFFSVTDFAAPLVAPGLFFGRIGNFINGELWGRLADPSLPWSMVFPGSGTMLPRHPSQIYESLLEGLCLFVLVWVYSWKKRPAGAVGALFCMGYAVARFCVEFFREPDSYIGYGLFGLTRGQWLTLPLLVLGAAVFVWANHSRRDEFPAGEKETSGCK